jgi:hypothetical protein
MSDGYFILNKRNKPVRARSEEKWYDWLDNNEELTFKQSNVYTSTPLGCITVTLRFSGFCDTLFCLRVESETGAEPVFIGNFPSLKEAKREHKLYVERLTERYRNAGVLITEDQWWDEMMGYYA